MDIFVVVLVFLTILFIIGFRRTSFVFEFDFPKDIFERLKQLPKDKRGSATKESVALIGTFTILLSSLYVILSGNYDAGTKNWAFGMVGAISGFWLRNEHK